MVQGHDRGKKAWHTQRKGFAQKAKHGGHQQQSTVLCTSLCALSALCAFCMLCQLCALSLCFVSSVRFLCA